MAHCKAAFKQWERVEAEKAKAEARAATRRPGTRSIAPTRALGARTARAKG